MLPPTDHRYRRDRLTSGTVGLTTADHRGIAKSRNAQPPDLGHTIAVSSALPFALIISASR
jgi:hypothetical protein